MKKTYFSKFTYKNIFEHYFFEKLKDNTTIPHKNIEANDKFYRKVAFLMYTEMVNFRPRTGH